MKEWICVMLMLQKEKQRPRRRRQEQCSMGPSEGSLRHMLLWSPRLVRAGQEMLTLSQKATHSRYRTSAPDFRDGDNCFSEDRDGVAHRPQLGRSMSSLSDL